MPTTILDWLPLPNLKVYTAGSVVLVSVSVYYAMSVTSDPSWRVNATAEASGGQGALAAAAVAEALPGASVPGPGLSNGTRNFTEQFVDVMTFMMQEPLCMWTLINAAYCALALGGLLVQRLVFGRLRAAEARRLKDKFWNYVFYKFIFVFGVINVQYVDELLLWAAWFSALGCLQLLATLCKDRYDYLASSPAASRWAHVRLLCLLGAMLASAAALLAVAAAWGLPAGKNMFAFMAAEVVLVALASLQVAARYVLRLRDVDAASALHYYTRLAFHGGALLVETLDVAHMVAWAQWPWSLGSLVLALQLRGLLQRLRAAVQRHSRYTLTKHILHHHYPMASEEEVARHEDKCAICWEPMKEARKLPCAHLFHSNCLCRWVQQDASCPTCRAPLPRAPPAPAPAPPAGPRAPPAPPAHLTIAAPMFRIDSWRYAWWLPAVSLQLAPPAPAQLRAMALQVQTLFPQYSAARLAADLARSRSPHATVDNILEGRLLPDLPEVLEERASVATATTHTASTGAQTAAGASVATATTHTASTGAQTAAGASVATATTLDHSRGTETEPAGAFPREPRAREASLRRRRELMVAGARRRYLARAAPPAPAAPAAD